MQLWRFLMPSALGFSLRMASQMLVDRVKGAPPLPLRVRDFVADNVGPLFGAAPYLDYVRGCGHYESEHRSHPRILDHRGCSGSLRLPARRKLSAGGPGRRRPGQE